MANFLADLGRFDRTDRVGLAERAKQILPNEEADIAIENNRMLQGQNRIKLDELRRAERDAKLKDTMDSTYIPLDALSSQIPGVKSPYGDTMPNATPRELGVITKYFENMKYNGQPVIQDIGGKKSIQGRAYRFGLEQYKKDEANKGELWTIRNKARMQDKVDESTQISEKRFKLLEKNTNASQPMIEDAVGNKIPNKDYEEYAKLTQAMQAAWVEAQSIHKMLSEKVETKLDPYTDYIEKGGTPEGWQELQNKGKGEKEFAPQIATQWIRTKDGKNQLGSYDEVNGVWKPAKDEQGNSIIVSDKERLQIEGKKTDTVQNFYGAGFGRQFGGSQGKALSELFTKAQDAIVSNEIIREGRGIVSSGMYAGSAANLKLGVDKWLQEAGVNIGGETASNTEQFAGLMGNQVGKVIKQFGSGTGLSDADREYAEKIAGGKITLTEKSILKLFDINERLNKFYIRHYNKNAATMRKSLETGDYIPEIEEQLGSNNLSDMSTEDLMKELNK